jgi:hypothetical protein
MTKIRTFRTLGILIALAVYLLSIATISPAGAETASVPVTVTAAPTTGLVDGSTVTVTVSFMALKLVSVLLLERLTTALISRRPFQASARRRLLVPPAPTRSRRLRRYRPTQLRRLPSRLARARAVVSIFSRAELQLFSAMKPMLAN